MTFPITVEFKKELTKLINEHSQENGSNTPDFILADYLVECLNSWNKAVKARDVHYRVWPTPGKTYINEAPAKVRGDES